MFLLCTDHISRVCTFTRSHLCLFTVEIFPLSSSLTHTHSLSPCSLVTYSRVSSCVCCSYVSVVHRSYLSRVYIHTLTSLPLYGRDLSSLFFTHTHTLTLAVLTRHVQSCEFVCVLFVCFCCAQIISLACVHSHAHISASLR